MKNLETALLTGVVGLALTTAAQAQTAFSLDENGTTLVRFAPDGSSTSSLELSGPNGEAISLDELTFRPQNGQLYGYDGSNGSLYTVNLQSGQTSLIFQNSALPDGFVSFDVNPNLDAFRFINANGANVVYFPQDTANADPMNSGRLITDAPTINAITYGMNYDQINGATGAPELLGNGYTNQLPLDQAQAENMSDPLRQYVLDANTNTIGVLNNNAGTVDFEGFAGFDFDLAGGFDVYTDGSSDVGYALLTVDGDQSLWAIDLASYTFSNILDVQSEFGTLTSLAVFDVEPIPVPAAGLLFLAGIGGLTAARKRRQKA
jgi:hypothetical protein